jgi:lauroyl/myristoyl acyltransferase
LKTVVLAVLRSLSRWWPRGAVLAAHVLASLTRPLGHGIADDWLAAVFPDLPPDPRRAARQRTWESFLKGEALDAAVRRGRGARDYPRAVPNPALSELRAPLVVASFHVGPFQALSAFVHMLPGTPAAVAREQYEARPDMTVLHRGADEWERARTFQRALGELRSGRSVIVSVDGLPVGDHPMPTIEVPMLGRSMPFARGPFALARLGRTPIVPMLTRWRGTAMEVTVGEPVAHDGGEASMAAAVAAWVERYLAERPAEVSVFLLERLRPPLPR